MTSSRKEQIRKNLIPILELVEDASKLVAVTKYSEFEDIKLAYELGLRDFGENRIESLEQKSQEAKELGLDEIRWHFIGNIQSGKISRIVNVENLFAIHSIDKESHLKKIIEAQTKAKLFIQVNTSGEVQKGGLENLVELQSWYSLYAHSISGLMTMGPIRGDDQLADAKVSFDSLRSMRDELDSSLSLSMGMSADFKVALACQSDYVRIGSAIFR